jgi:hypothetical protein
VCWSLHWIHPFGSSQLWSLWSVEQLLIFWRCSPIYFKHATFMMSALWSHRTTYQSNTENPIKKTSPLRPICLTYSGFEFLVHKWIVSGQKQNSGRLTRQNTLHPSPPTGCRRDVHQASQFPTISGRNWAAVFALRAESPVSSSGMKVLSVLENTDERYAL